MPAKKNGDSKRKKRKKGKRCEESSCYLHDCRQKKGIEERVKERFFFTHAENGKNKLKEGKNGGKWKRGNPPSISFTFDGNRGEGTFTEGTL